MIQNMTNTAMLAEASLPMAREGEVEGTRDRSFTLDTTFVLFFLALDMGQGWLTLGVDGMVSAIALSAFVVLPYFLPLGGPTAEFRSWIIGRLIIAAAGISLGLMLKQATGVLLPDYFRFLPLSLLIVAGIICCNVQIYGIIKYRLAK